MATIKVKDVTGYLDALAPPSYQEDYDNSGLLTGDSGWEVNGVLVTLDCVERVVEEAIARGCNLIVAHHPIIFRGLKKVSGRGYVERTIAKAIKNDIAIFAVHTNLDNVRTGVNKKIATRMGLVRTRILVPRTDTLLKLETYVPKDRVEEVLRALHSAGAGQIGEYSDCSFQTAGRGRFTPGNRATPHVGTAGNPEQADEIKVEVLVPRDAEHRVLTALRAAHPYEEVAFYLSSLQNENQDVGAGMIGELEEGLEPIEFLRRLKSSMATACIRHTAPGQNRINKVALCGGSGAFLLPQAIRAGADAFVSADFKYHEFFDADGKILIADIGHYESEQFTKDLLMEVLKEKFPTFAINFSEYVTNPISYL
jgi:dinuclear metal center YbgI/SA1388 family protein